MTHPVLVVGFEDPAVEALREEARAGAIAVLAANDRPDCLRTLYQERPRVIVLDVGRDADGPELCRTIREMCDVPILCLVSSQKSGELIEYLEAGADSCAPKSVGVQELTARLQALLRLSESSRRPVEAVVKVGEIEIDLEARRVTKAGRIVPLTPREFDLLAGLARRTGQVVRHEELLELVWGAEFQDDTHYLRLYVGYLRQKLEDNPSAPRYVLTERGVGYRLASNAAAPARGDMAA